MPFMFEKLEVYQKAVTFADRIIGLTKEFPKGYGFLADRQRAVNTAPIWG
jgi:hypothetical protein